MRLRFAPYASATAKAAKSGYAPTNSIVIAGDWETRKWPVWIYATWRAVVPPDHEPAEYDWRWVAGFDVILCARSKSRLEAISGPLLSSSPRRVVGIRPNAPTAVFKGA